MNLTIEQQEKGAELLKTLAQKYRSSIRKIFKNFIYRNIRKIIIITCIDCYLQKHEK